MNEYLKYLRKGLNNKKGKKRENECEQILGLPHIVDQFAYFYEQNEEELFIFIAATLERFQATKTYTSEQMDIYRMALTELPLFMEKCQKERDRRNQEIIEENKRKAEIAQTSIS